MQSMLGLAALVRALIWGYLNDITDATTGSVSSIVASVMSLLGLLHSGNFPAEVTVFDVLHETFTALTADAVQALHTGHEWCLR